MKMFTERKIAEKGYFDMILFFTIWTDWFFQGEILAPYFFQQLAREPITTVNAFKTVVFVI